MRFVIAGSQVGEIRKAILPSFRCIPFFAGLIHSRLSNLIEQRLPVLIPFL
jgi:hypothetical protein